jgi:hypothetical protein
LSTKAKKLALAIIDDPLQDGIAHTWQAVQGTVLQ